MAFRSLPVENFRQMCRDAENEKMSILGAGGIMCATCKGTGTHHGAKRTTLFGCKPCGGVGAIPHITNGGTNDK